MVEVESRENYIIIEYNEYAFLVTYTEYDVYVIDFNRDGEYRTYYLEPVFGDKQEDALVSFLVCLLGAETAENSNDFINMFQIGNLFSSITGCEYTVTRTRLELRDDLVLSTAPLGYAVLASQATDVWGSRNLGSLSKDIGELLDEILCTTLLNDYLRSSILNQLKTDKYKKSMRLLRAREVVTGGDYFKPDFHVNLRKEGEDRITISIVLVGTSMKYVHTEKIGNSFKEFINHISSVLELITSEVKDASMFREMYRFKKLVYNEELWGFQFEMSNHTFRIEKDKGFYWGMTEYLGCSCESLYLVDDKLMTEDEFKHDLKVTTI